MPHKRRRETRHCSTSEHLLVASSSNGGWELDGSKDLLRQRQDPPREHHSNALLMTSPAKMFTLAKLGQDATSHGIHPSSRWRRAG